MESYSKKARGKVVVITGASSGVGRAMAIEFARQGARLILASRRPESLGEVVKDCEHHGASANAITADTRDPDALKQLVQATVAVAGRIDIWINNAGVLAVGALEDIPSEVNEAVIKTNLLGYINGAQAVLPVFKKQGYGMLVNNISVGAWLATPYMAAYCASKFGLKGFSDALRGELKAYPNIHVCDLFPGFLDTPGVHHAANYTGKQLSPAPPLYDPRKVARMVVKLIDRPKAKSTLGVTPILLHLAYSLFPKLSRNITASTVNTYLNRANATDITSGNVLEPVAYGNGVEGGWRSTSLQPTPRTKLVMAGCLLAGLVLLARKL